MVTQPMGYRFQSSFLVPAMFMFNNNGGNLQEGISGQNAIQSSPFDEIMNSISSLDNLSGGNNSSGDMNMPVCNSFNPCQSNNFGNNQNFQNFMMPMMQLMMMFLQLMMQFLAGNSNFQQQTPGNIFNNSPGCPSGSPGMDNNGNCSPGGASGCPPGKSSGNYNPGENSGSWPGNNNAPPVDLSGVQGTAFGKQIAQQGARVANNMNSTGWCYRGVARALESCGVSVSGGSAYMAADQLARNNKFKEVKVSRDQLKSLPAGAVVVWNRSPGKEHGHISIALGNGKEASDHIQSQITNRPASYRVFLPVG